MSRISPNDSRRAIASWLLACCALVFAMVVVGGITRLTHSGLSIVEWQPIVGTIPPLDDAHWAETFSKYQRTPEFRLRNHDMTLEGFKEIFWWEYWHRLLGRVVGLVFLLPFLYFLARQRIDARLGMRLAVIFLLGGLQGALGWYMVKSGLVDDPRVSSVRLAAHLGLAFLLYASMLWVALGLLLAPAVRTRRGLARHGAAVVALVFVMALSGALVAAIKAGYAYNTFPLMNGEWLPAEILVIHPWWMNLIHNMATVQFNHRWLAMVIAIAVVALWWRIRVDRGVSPSARAWSHALLGAAAVQIAIGIATLLLRVPVPLAALHQSGALAVFTCAIVLAHSLRAKAH